LELLVNSSYIGIYSWKTDADLLGDFFVEQALGEKFQDFAFTRGEVFSFR